MNFNDENKEKMSRLLEDDCMTYYYPLDDEVLAIYHNSYSVSGGSYVMHYFPYDYIETVANDCGGLTKQIVHDFLFGDAFNCPTYCIDKGTCQYEKMHEWVKGDEPEDEAAYLLNLINTRGVNKEYNSKNDVLTYCTIEWVDNGKREDVAICSLDGERSWINDDYIFFYGLSRKQIEDGMNNNTVFEGEWRVVEIED